MVQLLLPEDTGRRHRLRVDTGLRPRQADMAQAQKRRLAAMVRHLPGELRLQADTANRTGVY